MTRHPYLNLRTDHTYADTDRTLQTEMSEKKSVKKREIASRL